MNARGRRKYFIITGLLIAAAFVVSLRVGKYPLSTRDIIIILSGGDPGAAARSVFYTLRLPRVAAALFAGAGLGMAGGVFQLIFKNPLAAPDIVGVSNGANLGAAIAIVFFGHSAVLMASSAFIGGMAATLLVITLSRFGRNSGAVTYILFGIILKSVSEAFIMMLKFYADPERELASIEYWSMGSLGGITASKLAAVLPFFFAGFIGLILMRRHIAMLSLEDDESRTLGVRVRLIRTVVLGFAALSVASLICLTGLIVFVGLNAPHAARLILKRTGFAWCVLSSMIGAMILLVSDCLARGFPGAEIPVSIPTILIGVPILLVFMRKRKAGDI